MKYLFIGILLIWISPFLGYWSMYYLFYYQNLSGEYTTLLEATLTGYRWIGLILCAGGGYQMVGKRQ